MINSRLITDLTPEAQALCQAHLAALWVVGVWAMLTSTYRDQESQDWIYASGRTRPGPILTKVKHSTHQDRIAWDIAIVDGKTPIWNVKVDVDQDGTPDYVEALKIGRSLNLVCGGDYSGWKDWCHYNLKSLERPNE